VDISGFCSTINQEISTINYQATNINYQPTNINYQISNINYQISNINYQLTPLTFSEAFVANGGDKFRGLRIFSHKQGRNRRGDKLVWDIREW